MKNMGDKTKVIVLSTLAALLLGVGAFQFIGKDQPSAAATAIEAESKPTDEAKGDDKSGIKLVASNKFVTGSYPARDPFKPIINPVQQTYNPNTAPSYAPTATPMPPAMIGGALPSGISIAPVVPAEPEFGYSLTGIIVGVRPAAVFVDAAGAQRLVQLGGSLDGDTKIVEISRTRVSLRHRNKTLNLAIGGGDTSGN